jgi:hypothetical protein
MKYLMTLFIAEKKINKFMQRFTIKPDYKWFVFLKRVSFVKDSKVTSSHFMKIINESKKEKDFWIPAIKFRGNFYCDKDVKELSDGKRVFFVNKKADGWRNR